MGALFGPNGLPIPGDMVDCSCKNIKKADTDVFEMMAWRSMTEKEIIERIVFDFLGPEKQEVDPRKFPTSIGRPRVEAYLARLVERYGGKLGGLSRNKLVSKVMNRMEARERKEAKARWAAYDRRS
jgi:hypothetical protein